MEEQELAKRMCKYYFFKYYIRRQMEPGVILHEEEMNKLFGCQYTNKFLPKNLKYFEKIIKEHGDHDRFNVEKFVDISIRYSIDYGVEFPYPPQLANEKMWQCYERNSIEKINLKDTFYRELIERVKHFFVFLNGRTVSQIVENPLQAIKIRKAYAEDNLDLCVYCFSKSFMKFAKEDGMLIDFHEEQSIIKKYEKLLEKIKEKLGDDFEEV